MDRVLAPGVAYELDDAAGEPRTLLALRRLVVLSTGHTEPEREAGVFGDPLDPAASTRSGSPTGGESC